jgi:hypothetical protein
VQTSSAFGDHRKPPTPRGLAFPLLANRSSVIPMTPPSFPLEFRSTSPPETTLPTMLRRVRATATCFRHRRVALRPRRQAAWVVGRWATKLARPSWPLGRAGTPRPRAKTAAGTVPAGKLFSISFKYQKPFKVQKFVENTILLGKKVK